MPKPFLPGPRLSRDDEGSLSAEAEAELLREVDCYSRARKGFGTRFNEAVQDAAERAGVMPEAGAPSLAGTRKFRVKGFPFNLHYRHDEREVLVVALAPDRKRPGYWLSRLGPQNVP